MHSFMYLFMYSFMYSFIYSRILWWFIYLFLHPTTRTRKFCVLLLISIAYICLGFDLPAEFPWWNELVERQTRTLECTGSNTVQGTNVHVAQCLFLKFTLLLWKCGFTISLSHIHVSGLCYTALISNKTQYTKTVHSAVARYLVPPD